MPPKQRRRRRRKLSWYIIWYTVFFFLLSSAVTIVISLPIWQITEVKVEGLRLLIPDEITRLANIPLAENVFLVRFDRAQKKLNSIPLIKKVEFHRVLPGTISIKVFERKETAVAVMGGASVLMDEEGVILNPAVTSEVHVNFPDITNLPVINGLQKSWIIKGRLSGEMGDSVIKLLSEFKSFISPTRLQVEVSDVENINLMVEDTLKVKIGDASRLDKKIRAFELIFNQNRTRKNDLEYIDVRSPDFPVVKFK